MKGLFLLVVLTAFFLIDPSLAVHENTPPQDQHWELVELDDCRVQQVTVFNDRAEVTRLVSLASLQPGTTEVSIVGLSPMVDRDSVRVSGSKGSATILEVSYNTRQQPKTKDDGTQHSALLLEKEQLEEQIDRHVENLDRIVKERQWVENWASSLTEPSTKSDANGLFAPQAIEQAMSFMKFYQTSLADLDDRRAAIGKELKALRMKLESVVRALDALNAGSNPGHEVHEVLVLLSTESPGPLELELAYVVMGASWYAAYDLRTESTNSNLDLTYYGVIINHSFDNWRDAPVSLSTAQPSVGGAPPHLPTQHVYFYQTHGGVYGAPRAYHKMAEMSAMSYGGDAEFADGNDVRAMTATTKESSICASFEIPRRSTILSDNKPHKVTIDVIRLEAEFSYELIPSLSTYAYLKASIVNNLGKYLLAGDMNVFLDGNFVTKTRIQDVWPAENFELYLGVDKAIKVTYAPAETLKDTQGFLQQSNLKTVKHLTTIKNSKSTEVHMTVLEQLPLSNDKQLQVRLLKPALRVRGNCVGLSWSPQVLVDLLGNFFCQEGDDSTTITAANHLMWKLDIKPGQQIQLPFEYQLEWPLNKEINI